MSTGKLSQNLDLRQTQNLVMTPQLQQAIKMLQLNNIELSELIEEELAHNPLLEKAEPEREESSLEGSAPDQIENNHTDNDGAEENYTAPAQGTEDKSFRDGDDFDAGTAMMGSGGNLKFEDGDTGFESTLAKQATLREHLTEQLFLSFDDERDIMVGGLLIDMLDESGYLRGEHDDLCDQTGCSIERFERILTKMKGFDPTGIFAGNLAECMALQLEERGALDAPMRALLDNLDLIARHDFKSLANICGVNDTYLRDMIAEIRTLNPKPAAEFDHVVVQTAIPDVLMKRLPKHVGGGWRVELNNDTLPRVLVNNQYYTEVSSRTTQKKDKEYLSNQLASANWLIRAMDQRAQTIMKVAAEIVEEQDAFFNYGIEFLQPLKLKDIADKIEMHESTVSRVTTNKYIGTPRGIFELKFFFSTALGGDDGGMAHAADAVKAKIKNLIDAEDPKKILSDDTIVDILKTEGIDIARRTVAKYREAMHIGSSVQRRREKSRI